MLPFVRMCGLPVLYSLPRLVVPFEFRLGMGYT